MLRCLLSFTIALVSAPWTPSAYAQSLLENVSVFATVAGLNTVPDHGDAAVSFLDYRNAGYSIIAVDVPSGEEHDLERVFYAEPVVSTYGPRVAWIGYTPLGQPDVYVHDRPARRTIRITSDASFQNHPDLSEAVLVWQDYRNAGPDELNADVYMHEFASNSTSPVTTDPGYQDLPRTHGNWVVWQDYRHSDAPLETADIYAYNMATAQELRLTTGSFYRTHPAVWGDLVVWEDYRNGDEGDIYLHDLSTGQELPVVTHAAHQGHPSVYGDWVLWLDYRNSSEQGDLYGYNLRTQQEYELLVHPAHQDAPHVYGNYVVWQDYRDGRFDIFGGVLRDPTSTSLEDRPRPVDAQLTAAPNPFVDELTLALKNAPAVPLDLKIYDVLGREVVRRQLASGDATIAWDGRGDAGRSVPSGWYVAVVSGRDVLLRVPFVRQR